MRLPSMIVALGERIERGRVDLLGAGLDGDARLSGAGHIEREERHAVRQIAGVADDGIFLAAVEAADGHDDRRLGDALRLAQIADDLLAVIGEAHRLDRRIDVAPITGGAFQHLLVGFCGSRRILQREAREQVVLHRVLVGLRRRRFVGGLERLGFREMAVADRAPDRRPMVALLALEIGERFAHFGGIELRHRIGAPVGAGLNLLLQLFERARRRELRQRGQVDARRSMQRRDRHESQKFLAWQLSPSGIGAALAVRNDAAMPSVTLTAARSRRRWPSWRARSR